MFFGGSETKKTSRPNSEDKKSRETFKVLTKQSSNTGTKEKRVLIANREINRCTTPPAKFTQIPKLKSESNKSNASSARCVKFFSSVEREILNEELDEKLRLLEAKEKSIAQYYEKVKELNGKVLELHKGFLYFDGSKAPKGSASSTTSFTRSLASDGMSVNQKEVTSELLSNFEKNIYQISDIWLRPSLDLSNILSNFKNRSALDSDEFQIENSKIQLAIKQAKSLTLMKTRGAIAEVKKLFSLKDGVQNEVEDVEGYGKGNETDVQQKDEMFGGAKTEESGDSGKTINSNSALPTTKTGDGSLTKDKDTGNYSNDATENKNIMSYGSNHGIDPELAKKNETIIFLNNKIFEFQKACNQHLLENSQLQYKIAEMNEKNQWNQVFWQQISKLKDRIKILQQNNRQLEAQKKEYELKIGHMKTDIDKLNRLNQLLKKQINMLHEKQANAGKEATAKAQSGAKTDSSSRLREKERIIEELKNILVSMRGQEAFAHQKITEFETKIEKFKKERI